MFKCEIEEVQGRSLSAPLLSLPPQTTFYYRHHRVLPLLQQRRCAAVLLLMLLLFALPVLPCGYSLMLRLLVAAVMRRSAAVRRICAAWRPKV
jgi:hypothetical protein